MLSVEVDEIKGCIRGDSSFDLIGPAVSGDLHEVRIRLRATLLRRDKTAKVDRQYLAVLCDFTEDIRRAAESSADLEHALAIARSKPLAELDELAVMLREHASL